MVKKFAMLILFYTPFALLSVPVYMLYLAIKGPKHKKVAKNKQWQPESPYEQPSAPNRNTHYGVDL